MSWTIASSDDPSVTIWVARSRCRSTVALGFRNVHFSPRGGGFGWAMPLGVGI